jgi:hypothetical protein
MKLTDLFYLALTGLMVWELLDITEIIAKWAFRRFSDGWKITGWLALFFSFAFLIVTIAKAV